MGTTAFPGLRGQGAPHLGCPAPWNLGCAFFPPDIRAQPEALQLSACRSPSRPVISLPSPHPCPGSCTCASTGSAPPPPAECRVICFLSFFFLLCLFHSLIYKHPAYCCCMRAYLEILVEQPSETGLWGRWEAEDGDTDHGRKVGTRGGWPHGCLHAFKVKHH